MQEKRRSYSNRLLHQLFIYTFDDLTQAIVTNRVHSLDYSAILTSSWCWNYSHQDFIDHLSRSDILSFLVGRFFASSWYLASCSRMLFFSGLGNFLRGCFPSLIAATSSFHALTSLTYCSASGLAFSNVRRNVCVFVERHFLFPWSDCISDKLK